MDKTIFIIRIFFLVIAMAGAALFNIIDPPENPFAVYFFAACLAGLVILVDIYLKGFSLRGLSALTFGLTIGVLIAWLISSSPLFEPLEGEPGMEENLFLVRLVLFVVLMYLGAVISLRGKDEFNLVIPYVKFVPENVQAPFAIVDTSVLIDGRIQAICQHGWMGFTLVIPNFVIGELQQIADSPDPQRKARGRKGLEVLNQLRSMKDLDIRIHESDVEKVRKVDAKLVFLAKSMKAKLMTTDYNLAKVAEFEGVPWLNLHHLSKDLNPEIEVGLSLEVELVKPGKEPNQAVGYLGDGSMVVVNNGHALIGQKVLLEVTSIVPTNSGRLIFAELT